MARGMHHIRNMGIMAHIDAGKTTVSERLLFVTGKAHKMGEVHEGEATMDWMVQERERGITITSAVTTFEWRKSEIHLIDTPGHVDFTIEVSRSLRVLDGVVTVLDAVAGVEPQTETVWRQADHYRVPRIGFVNKMDRIGADFGRCLAMMVERFGDHCIAAQLPIGVEGAYRGIVDLVTRRAVVWPDPDDPRALQEIPVPDGLADDVETARDALLERVALADEAFCRVYLEDSAAVPPEQIHAAIRRAVVAGHLVPVLCGSALRNKGIQPLLDAIVGWLPSPEEVPPISGHHPETGAPLTRPHASDAPVAGLAYKVAMMEDGRRMVFLRLYSGSLSVGQELYNPALQVREKVSRIFLMHANHRTRLDRIDAGNIFGVLGLKRARTGDTLCDFAHPILLEAIDAYEPVISQSIEPATLREKDKMEETLAKLADEDPTFRWYEDSGTGQTIIRGMGELHLDILVDRLRREFQVDVRTGKPQVVYRETIASPASGEAVFDRTGESGEQVFGAVGVRVTPRARGQGNQIGWEWSHPGGPAAPWFGDPLRSAVLDGLKQGLGSGALQGYPVDDVDVQITSIGAKDGVTTPVGYAIAASSALRKALSGGSPLLLSPVAKVEVSTPPEHTGEIIGSLNQRRGRIEAMEEQSPQLTIIKCTVPMERMFGYATEVRSLSQGRASFTMAFSHYDRL